MDELKYDILHRVLHGEKLVYEGLKVNTTEAKPLHPLTHGKILMVGVKASNFDDEIRTHPRVIMWDSQNEHWLNKNMPDNVQAVFMTRWIGHDAFNNIVKEARKRHITIFNPQGTGLIAKQVRQLLNISLIESTKAQKLIPTVEVVTEPKIKETTMTTHGKQNKLKPLHQFIDSTKSVPENVPILLQKAKELGIETSKGSVAQMLYVMRRKSGSVPLRKRRFEGVEQVVKPTRTVDVSVEILNNIIKELQDMRDFIDDTVAENTRLRAKVDKFKKFFDE